MTKIRILDYPDPKLKRIGRKVEVVNDEVKQVIADMFETHYATENCAALAATQLDFADPWAITVIDFSENKDDPLCLINPEIIESDGEQFEYEGCMSVYPDHLHERVKRADRIVVSALNEQGERIELSAEGYMAKCLQHEIDHLNGLTYLDRLSPLKRQRLLDKLHKVKKK
ncbi:MAG: peptide deformylase [Gammaproteobacteria bacterium]|nr:peptide deformylase [Gammaproteobacteria bacterium]